MKRCSVYGERVGSLLAISLAAATAWSTLSVADPLPLAGPADLARLPRKIAREPKYAGSPRYCLLAFGPDARKRMWLALDGTSLYVDRTGKGDLTLPGCRVVGKDGTFHIGDVIEADGKTRDTRLVLQLGAPADPQSTHKPEPYQLSVFAKGSFEMRAWPRMAARPQDAPVVHFDGPLTLRINDPVVLQPGGRTVLRFAIATPGSGPGAEALVFHQGIPDGIAPVAEFHYPSADPAHPLVQQVPLQTRCCGALFKTLLAVPRQATAGQAEVRLTFPDWTEGMVRGSVDRIPIH